MPKNCVRISSWNLSQRGDQYNFVRQMLERRWLTVDIHSDSVNLENNGLGRVDPRKPGKINMADLLTKVLGLREKKKANCRSAEIGFLILARVEVSRDKG